MSRIAVLLLVVVVGCRAAVQAQFADRPIVTRSDDARPIPEPAEGEFFARFYLADALVFRPMFDGLAPLRQRPAGDVNALDEVPDSTWFTNRIGVRSISPAEAARAADTKGAPVPPFEVTNAKRGGANPGFIAKDSRGIKYLIKFDTTDNPGQQTATNAIVQRIFWTLGYHTPSDYVVHFQRAQVTIAPKLHGKFHDADLDVMLKAATRRADGAFRATASQFLGGIPKAGWSDRGRRGDDPNDRVRHEERRVVRGLRVFAAWLNHTDMKEDNTLDMYEGEKGQGHLVHYLVDFGEAFGGHQSEKNQPQIGFEYALDWKNQSKAFVAFGLWHRPWEAQRPTRWPQVGFFSAVAFDPARWRERYPYTPFSLADRADLYWGAKLVMRFDRPMLEAIVATGDVGDAAASAYLVDTLLARREAIGRAFLDGVTPLDELTLVGATLCGVDLARRYGVARDGTLNHDGVRDPIAADGRVCMAINTEPGYHVARVAISRHGHTTPALEIHYVGGPSPHVVGLVR